MQGGEKERVREYQGLTGQIRLKKNLESRDKETELRCWKQSMCRGREEWEEVGGARDGEQTRKGPECVFSGLKACDSARLIRESSQEALVGSIPSSHLLSFPSIYPFCTPPPPLHSLPLIYDFRLSYLHKYFSMKNKFHAKDICPHWSTHGKRTHEHNNFQKDTPKF